MSLNVRTGHFKSSSDLSGQNPGMLSDIGSNLLPADPLLGRLPPVKSSQSPGNTSTSINELLVVLQLRVELGELLRKSTTSHIKRPVIDTRRVRQEGLQRTLT